MIRLIGFILAVYIILPASSQKPTAYQRACAHNAKGEFAFSEQMLNNLIENTSKPDTRYYYHRGIARFNQRKYELALQDFEAASINAMFIPENDLWIAKTAAKLNYFNKTSKYILRYLDENPLVDEKTVTADSAFKEIKKSDAWFKLWEDYQPTTLQLHIKDAKYYLKKQQFEVVHQFSENAANDTIAEYFHYLSAKAYLQEKRYANALDNINKSLLVQNKLNYSTLKAQILLGANKYEALLEVVDEIIKKHPENLYIYKLRIKANMGLALYEDAEADLQLCLALYPEDDELLVLSGKNSIEAGSYMQALKHLNVLYKMDKMNAELYFLRGRAYQETNMHKYALQNFAMSLDLNPRIAETYHYYGISLHKTGNTDKACRIWTKASAKDYKPSLEMILEYCNH